MHYLRYLLLSLPMLLASCSPCCWAQIELAARPVELIAGLKGAQIVGDYVLVEAGATPLRQAASIISVTGQAPTEFKVFDIAAEALPGFEPGDLIKLSVNQWLLVGTLPRYRVTAFGLEPGYVKARPLIVDFASDPIPPTPPTPPGPLPVPVDVDNTYGVGKPALANAPADAAAARKYAAIYRAAAEFLYGRPSLKFIVSDTAPDNNDPDRSVLAWINQQISQVECRDQATCQQWTAWRAQLRAAFLASQQQRQFTRGDWYLAFREVAAALDKVK